MRSGDTYRFHIRVVFDLVVFDPGCEGFDVFSGIIQTIGLGIQSHEIVHYLDGIVYWIDLILGSQSPADITGAVIQDHHEFVVSGFGFLIALQPAELSYS